MEINSKQEKQKLDSWCDIPETVLETVLIQDFNGVFEVPCALFSPNSLNKFIELGLGKLGDKDNEKIIIDCSTAPWQILKKIREHF